MCHNRKKNRIQGRTGSAIYPHVANATPDNLLLLDEYESRSMRKERDDGYLMLSVKVDAVSLHLDIYGIPLRASRDS